ncbi:MAG: hypothetical protein ACOCSE_05130, partial [Chitinivibrionales bacterium]
GYRLAYKDYMMESMYSIEPGISARVTPGRLSLGLSVDIEREKITNMIYEDLQNDLTYTLCAGVDLYWRINDFVALNLDLDYREPFYPEERKKERSFSSSMSTGVSF